MIKILLIEDDHNVTSYISKGLKELGHNVTTADNGKDGLFLASTEEYDVIVCDRMLPSLDGLALIKTLRGAGNETPILILSALADVDDRVTGLRAGGDDYLTKPFAFEELIARAEVLAKRKASEGQSQPTVLKVADLQLDLLARTCSRGNRKIDLQPREFNLLEYLIRHKGQLVTRTLLLEAVWDYHFDPQTNVTDVHISRLRKKIDGEGDEPLIKTRRGAGYIIE